MRPKAAKDPASSTSPSYQSACGQFHHPSALQLTEHVARCGNRCLEWAIQSNAWRPAFRLALWHSQGKAICKAVSALIALRPAHTRGVDKTWPGFNRRIWFQRSETPGQHLCFLAALACSLAVPHTPRQSRRIHPVPQKTPGKPPSRYGRLQAIRTVPVAPDNQITIGLTNAGSSRIPSCRSCYALDRQK